MINLQKINVEPETYLKEKIFLDESTRLRQININHSTIREQLFENETIRLQKMDITDLLTQKELMNTYPFAPDNIRKWFYKVEMIYDRIDLGEEDWDREKFADLDQESTMGPVKDMFAFSNESRHDGDDDEGYYPSGV